MYTRTLLAIVQVAASTLFATAASSLADIGGFSKRQDVCQDPGFVPCYPAGSVSLGAPDAYEDPNQYLNSMTLSGIGGLSAKMAKRDLVTKRQEALCCNPAVQCLVLPDYNIPFCYDPSSTSYVFSDGSGGTVATGDTFDAEGNTLNLVTGDYQFANGTTGNLYAERNIPPPNTSTLAIPQPSGTSPPTSTAIGGRSSTTINGGGSTTISGGSSTATGDSSVTGGSAATSTKATPSSTPETASSAVRTRGAAAAALVAGIMFSILLF